MIVGIDLGTSTSEIAYLVNEEIVLIPNHLGQTVTPSVVNISQDGTITVGEEAKEKAILEPESTFLEVKRLMGSNTVLQAHGKTYTPQKISSMILKYLVDCAEAYTKEKVDRAVITVPAYFNDEQRQATVEAGELIGLKVERIINEPTSAALDYGLANLEKCENILIYDFGGGTLDVTVLELFEGVIGVASSCGNNKLGGKDFDQAIIDHLAKKFYSQHNVDITNNARAMMRMKKEAEACKMQLSTCDTYKIQLPFFATVQGEPVSLEEEISRDEFIELVKDMVGSTETQVMTALKEAGLAKQDLDLVLLIGGTTKIPYIEGFITELLGMAPKKLVDPDFAVVRGAAIQSGIMDDAFKENELTIVDVCPYTLSTTVLDMGYYGEIKICDPIIEKNTSIPVSKEKIYVTCSDSQTKVEVTAYQGDSKNPKKNNLLNEFVLEGIPPKPAGQEEIKVKFTYNINGILEVEAEIVSTGKKCAIEISTTGVQMIEEVDVSGYEKLPAAKKFKALIFRAEELIESGRVDTEELEDLLLDLKRAIVQNRTKDELNHFKSLVVSELYDLEEDEEQEDDDELL